MKILESGRKLVDKFIYTAKCPRCGCKFQFSSEEAIMSYDWQGINCPNCKHPINYDSYKDSEEHRLYEVENIFDKVKWEDDSLKYEIVY